MHVLPAGIVGSLSPWLVPTSNPTFTKFLSVTLEDVHLSFTILKWTESTSVVRVVPHHTKTSHEFKNTEFYYKFTEPMDFKI